MGVWGRGIAGDVFRRLVDQPQEIVLRLEPGSLGREEAEDDGLVLRDEAKRLEAAGALAVVLQQEPIVTKLPECLLGDPVVAALGEPATAVVSAAHGQTEGDAGAAEALDDGVVGGHGLGDPAIGLHTAVTPPPAPRF